MATRVLTKAPKRGTVKIRVQDIYTGDSCFVLMHNVLYVPGLNRRLISVRQWNLNRGDIHFGMNHCTLSVYDPINEKTLQFAVKPPMQPP